MKELALCFVVLTVFVGVTFEDKVPVLIWSNDRSLTLPHPLAGHTISQEKFVHHYLDVLKRENALNVVLFIQDELNLNEITQNAGVYDEENDALKQLKEIMSSMSVAQLPSVDSPLPAIAELKNHFLAGSVHELQPPYNVDSLHLGLSNHNLLVVRLPRLQGGESSYREHLQHIDDIVGTVTSHVKMLQTPFVAVYTAATSSDQEQSNRRSNMAAKRSGRQLLQTTGSPNGYTGGLIANVSGMFMLYADNITLSFENEQIQLSTNYLWDTDATQCSNSSINCTVVLTYNNGTDKFQLTISSIQTTGSNAGYWYVNAMQVNSSTTGSVSFNPAFMELTPVGYSYHCFPPTNVSALNATLAVSNDDFFWTITFVNLQIQAFGLYPGLGFGYYNDCTCFFTLGIWMGIIAGAVMLAILLFGICMLLDIKTMDRFDDPKGKTIIVTATD